MVWTIGLIQINDWLIDWLIDRSIDRSIYLFIYLYIYWKDNPLNTIYVLVYDYRLLITTGDCTSPCICVKRAWVNATVGGERTFIISKIRITFVVGFLRANLQLALPFHSRLRVRHKTDRQTDRQTDRRRPSTLNAPTLWDITRL